MGMRVVVVPGAAWRAAVGIDTKSDQPVCLPAGMASIVPPFVDRVRNLQEAGSSHAPGYRSEVVATNAIGSAAVGRIRHDHGRRSHSCVVEGPTGSLTWAETDMPCCEQSQTPLLPNSGLERSWPSRACFGACREIKVDGGSGVSRLSWT